MTITEGAGLLGVSGNPARNWDPAGKFEAPPNPTNPWRLYGNGRRGGAGIKGRGTAQE